MPMSPSQILTQIREHYCDRLRAAVKDFVSDGIITLQSECVLRRPDGSLAMRGDPPTPTRVDLITLVNGEVRDGLTIESDTMPSFPPMNLNWQHAMPVQIGPFPWNACDVRFVGAVGDWSSLVNWFDIAFDAEEEKTPGEDGLIGVVHTMTRLAPDHWQIDFGSADLTAFENFLDALKQCGVADVRIGKLLQ